MKKLFYLTLISIGMFSCDSDNEIDTYNEFADIKFTVTSTEIDRQSEIESMISNGTDDTGSTNLHIVDESYSNEHLPYTQEYIHQTVFHATILSLYFKDNSGAPIGQPFEPYTVTLNIYVDSNVVAEEEIIITDSGQVVNAGYDFSFF